MHETFRGAICCIAFSANVTAQAPAHDWPQFRGPMGSGVASATRAPKELSLERTLLWRECPTRKIITRFVR